MQSDTSSIPYFGTGSELTVNDKLKNVAPPLRHVLNSPLQTHPLLSGTGNVSLKRLTIATMPLAPPQPSHDEDGAQAAPTSSHVSLSEAVICNTPRFGWHSRDPR